jgi:hypothetical protein
MNLPLCLPDDGPVVNYLTGLLESPDEGHKAAARAAMSAVKRVLATPDGAILMELLEKSTTQFFFSPFADPRACDALNAQRFIALDLRRIESDDGRHHPERRKPTFHR